MAAFRDAVPLSLSLTCIAFPYRHLTGLFSGRKLIL